MIKYKDYKVKISMYDLVDFGDLTEDITEDIVMYVEIEKEITLRLYIIDGINPSGFESELDNLLDATGSVNFIDLLNYMLVSDYDLAIIAHIGSDEKPVSVSIFDESDSYTEYRYSVDIKCTKRRRRVGGSFIPVVDATITAYASENTAEYIKSVDSTGVPSEVKFNYYLSSGYDPELNITFNSENIDPWDTEVFSNTTLSDFLAPAGSDAVNVDTGWNTSDGYKVPSDAQYEEDDYILNTSTNLGAVPGYRP